MNELIEYLKQYPTGPTIFRAIMSVTYSFRYDQNSGGIYGVDSGGFLLEESELEQLVEGLKIFYRHHGSMAVIAHNEERKREVYDPPPRTEERKQEVERSKKRGYVYLLRHGDHYKIGITNDLTTRIKQISPVMPLILECLGAIKTNDMFGLEAELHGYYSDYRMNGEWFDIPESELYVIQDMFNVPEEQLP